MIKPEKDFFQGLKWLMFFRVIFTTLLLGSTIALQSKTTSLLSEPVLVLYGLIIFVFLLSFIYAILIRYIKQYQLFAYVQLSIDTVVVTLIIFVTGSFSSIFSFLYLLVITYSAILLFRNGSLIIAALCSIQYGLLVDFEYYGLITPFGAQMGQSVSNYGWSYVLYKVLITMLACFAVAFLSSLLSERERRTKRELKSMEDHVKRVEKLAAIGEMAAGLAHEIKNPLASLTGCIQILRQELRYDPDHEKLMQIVLREADRLSSLVMDFLMFAKPQASRIQTINLEQNIQETVSLFEKDKTCYERITITKDYIPNIWVQMDPIHLHQILWNLLLNAAESIEGTGQIHLQMNIPKGNHVEIRIFDSGYGMTEKQIKTIFDPFYTTKPNGTGLGLSIVHSILEYYDSRLDVESEINQGTTMTIKLKQIKPQLKLDTSL